MVDALMHVAYLGQQTGYACIDGLDDGQLLGADVPTNHHVKHFFLRELLKIEPFANRKTSSETHSEPAVFHNSRDVILADRAQYT